MQAQRLDYNPGPHDVELRRFRQSNAQVRGIMGPLGSGKTSCCLMEIPRRGVEQQPSPADGVRYSRWGIFRDTYRNLERTTIPSWLEWMPKGVGDFRGGSSGEPAVHLLQGPLADGSRFHIEILFIAIQDWDIEDVFRGFPLTGAYLNEADRLAIDVLHLARTRVGRYPPERHGFANWAGVWCDFNAPNWGYPIEDFFISNKPDGVDFFRQPSGLAPNAENKHRLRPGYYEQQMEGQPEHWVRRMIKNEIGFSREGKPVYPEFSDSFHVAQMPIKLLKGVPILVGADAGRSPAAVFTQKDHEGQVRAIGELVVEDCGAERFGERLAEYVALHFPVTAKIVGVCDPTATEPTESANKDEDAWVEIVSRKSRIKFHGAPGANKSSVRKEALRQPLLKNITANKPAFLVSPDCKMLRQGLNHGYCYARRKVGHDLYNEVPEKNAFSHVVEACEYAMIEQTGYAAIVQRVRHREGRLPSHVDYRPGAYR